MSDFDLNILKKYLFIPLLVLCIPILWGPALGTIKSDCKTSRGRLVWKPVFVFAVVFFFDEKAAK
jgi:hypothetical protein